MTAIVTIGIDLARPTVPRAKLLELIAALPPCLIGVEACSGECLTDVGKPL